MKETQILLDKIPVGEPREPETATQGSDLQPVMQELPAWRAGSGIIGPGKLTIEESDRLFDEFGEWHDERMGAMLAARRNRGEQRCRSLLGIDLPEHLL